MDLENEEILAWEVIYPEVWLDRKRWEEMALLGKNHADNGMNLLECKMSIQEQLQPNWTWGVPEMIAENKALWDI